MKEVKVKIGNLFKVIEELEHHSFKINKGFNQQSKIQIQDENNIWHNVPSMIQKEDKIVEILFSDNNTLKCGCNHKLITDKNSRNEVFAKDVKREDAFEKIDGEKIQVVNVKNTGIINKVFDLQIDSENHLYRTSNGLIHHNTMISALFPYIFRKHKILYLFDSIDLIHQTYNDFVDDYNIDPDEIAIIQGANYKYDAEKSRIILLSIKSYEKAFHIFPQVKVIVYDECHSSGRTSQSQGITYSCQNASIHVGLSATPDRIKNPAEQLRLYANVGPIVYQKRIIEQIDGKFISNIQVNLYKMSFPDDEMIGVTGSYNDIYEKTKVSRTFIQVEMRKLFKMTIKQANAKIKTYFDDDLKVEEVDLAIQSIINKYQEENPNNTIIKEDGFYYFKQFMSYGDESTHYILNDIRNDKIAEIAKDKERVLILYNKIKHGEELLKRLPSAYLISGQSNQDDRYEAEKYLKENKDAIVISSKIWSKGKNIPEIEHCINAGAGVSEIEQIQKMGRAVRLSAKTNKKIATVHDFEDTFSPLAIKQSNVRKRIYKDEDLKISYVG